MKKTIVIYGSSTGTCEAIAEKIASKLGCEALNVQNLTADIVAANQNLILGTSTWGAGDLQSSNKFTELARFYQPSLFKNSCDDIFQQCPAVCRC